MTHQSQNKIIFTGPAGAGISTAILSISDTHPERPEPLSTTLVKDYGKIDLNGGEQLHLYGTPGQQRTDHTMASLLDGGIGLIIFLDNSRPDPINDLWLILDNFKDFVAQTGVAIGVTHMDTHPKPAIEDYHWQLQLSKLKPPVFTVDARMKNDVSLLVQSLLFSLDQGLVE